MITTALNRKSVLLASALLVSGFGLPMLSAQAQQTLYLPNVVELSGPGAVSGTNWRDGITLAVEEINAKGGILGRKLELENLDTQSDAGISRAQMRRAARSLAISSKKSL